jgi:small subunit ribosomal protein S10e
MVLIDKKEKRRVYEELIKEGVIVIKKDWTEQEHPNIKGVQPIKVWMLLRSLKSKDLVTELFNWNHFYFFLKKEGLDFVRQHLHIEGNVEPATYAKDDRKFVINEEKARRPRTEGGKPPARGGRGKKAGEGVVPEEGAPVV